MDDHSEDIRLSWCRAKAVPLECEVPSYSGMNQYFRNPAKGKGRKGNDKPILFLCLTQDSDLAALLGKTAEAYDNEREDV